MKNFLYLDNGATSYPKPDVVIREWLRYTKEIGASPGRGGYAPALAAGKALLKTRKAIAELIGGVSPKRVVFTKNATEALNIAIFGLAKKNWHIVSTKTEHNAVRRPLLKLAQDGVVSVDWAGVHKDGSIDIDNLFSLVRPETKMIVIDGLSNVTGLPAPIMEIGNYAREHGIIFVVDAAQLLGTVPVNVNTLHIDLLAFTGHKNLYGPPGTGGLYIRECCEPDPLLYGGTGGHSKLAGMPDALPNRYEAGTMNASSLAALGGGVNYIIEQGIKNIEAHKRHLAQLMVEGITALPLRLIGNDNRIGTVSVVPDRMHPSDFAQRLWDEHRIAIRAGFHCAPDIHYALGLENGSARFSFGLFNTEDDVAYAVDAVKKVLQ